jgi:hypothetical protein
MQCVFSYLIHLRKKKTNTDKHMQDTITKTLAILLAIFLNPIDVPDIRLNRTPFNDRRGNLHTSISHDTTESVFGSPCTQSKRNFSRCS